MDEPGLPGILDEPGRPSRKGAASGRTLAFVNTVMLRWARESAGYSVEDAAKSVGLDSSKLAAAEAGESRLTLRQAESIAKRYERPLATLYLPKAPEEEPPENQYRRLPDSPAPPWPKEVRALARRVLQRQLDAEEIYALLEEPPPWRRHRSLVRDSPTDTAESARQALGVSLEIQQGWRDRTGYLPLRSWTDAVEGLGVLVIQDGTAPLSQLRGFAAIGESVPAIVVNAQDDPRARIFTLIHELGHHLLEATRGNPPPDVEIWCNGFAAEVLTPAAPFEEDFRLSLDPDRLRTADALALTYGVTPDAAAVRVGTLQLLPADEVQALRRLIERRSNARQPQRGRGDYYATTLGRLGPRFTSLVFAALDSQLVSYSDAASLLGVKVNHFSRLREQVGERGQVG